MRRGKKQNYNKTNIARLEWMAGKKIGRRQQTWVWDREPAVTEGGLPGIGHWEKT